MHHTFVRLFFFSLLATVLTSCITARKINYLQYPDREIPSYKDTIQYSDYRIKAGDKLSVRVYSTHEETNAVFNSGYTQSFGYSQSGTGGTGTYSDLFSYEVLPTGNIIFPMIGEVYMLGMTIREATTQLEKAINPLFLVSTVEVRVLSKYFSIIGSGRSGYYPIVREKINIYQAMAMAGDVGIYGDRSKIRIIRETESGTVIRKFDLRSRDILHSEFFYIEPNDVIYIQTMDEQFFSIQNLPGLFSTTITSISFGVFLFNFIFSGSN
jgi:polysaccharide export outer membrane protein